MADQLELCSYVFDELTINELVSYNTGCDEMEDLGGVGNLNI